MPSYRFCSVDEKNIEENENPKDNVEDLGESSRNSNDASLLPKSNSDDSRGKDQRTVSEDTSTDEMDSSEHQAKQNSMGDPPTQVSTDSGQATTCFSPNWIKSPAQSSDNDSGSVHSRRNSASSESSHNKTKNPPLTLMPWKLVPIDLPVQPRSAIAKEPTPEVPPSPQLPDMEQLQAIMQTVASSHQVGCNSHQVGCSSHQEEKHDPEKLETRPFHLVHQGIDRLVPANLLGSLQKNYKNCCGGNCKPVELPCEGPSSFPPGLHRVSEECNKKPQPPVYDIDDDDDEPVRVKAPSVCHKPLHDNMREKMELLQQRQKEKEEAEQKRKEEEHRRMREAEEQRQREAMLQNQQMLAQQQQQMFNGQQFQWMHSLPGAPMINQFYGPPPLIMNPMNPLGPPPLLPFPMNPQAIPTAPPNPSPQRMYSVPPRPPLLQSAPAPLKSLPGLQQLQNKKFCKFCSYVIPDGDSGMQHYVNTHADRDPPVHLKRPELCEADEVDDSTPTKTGIRWLDDLSYIPPGSIFPERQLCKLCPFTATLKPKFLQHMLDHRAKKLAEMPKPPPKTYYCRFCPEQMTDVDAFYQHNTLHTGEFMYGCGHCSFKGPTEDSVNVHSIKKHVARNFLFNKIQRTDKGSVVYGYACSSCCFVQMERKIVESHIVYQHKRSAKIIRVNMNKNPPSKAPAASAAVVNKGASRDPRLTQERQPQPAPQPPTISPPPLPPLPPLLKDIPLPPTAAEPPPSVLASTTSAISSADTVATTESTTAQVASTKQQSAGAAPAEKPKPSSVPEKQQLTNSLVKKSYHNASKYSHRRSRSPVPSRRSRSPVPSRRRSRSRSPPSRYKSRSPPRRHRSKSPSRRYRSRSPSHRHRSRSPPRRYKSRTPPRRRHSSSSSTSSRCSRSPSVRKELPKSHRVSSDDRHSTSVRKSHTTRRRSNERRRHPSFPNPEVIDLDDGDASERPEAAKQATTAKSETQSSKVDNVVSAAVCVKEQASYSDVDSSDSVNTTLNDNENRLDDVVKSSEASITDKNGQYESISDDELTEPPAEALKTEEAIAAEQMAGAEVADSNVDEESLQQDETSMDISTENIGPVPSIADTISKLQAQLKLDASGELETCSTEEENVVTATTEPSNSCESQQAQEPLLSGETLASEPAGTSRNCRISKRRRKDWSERRKAIVCTCLFVAHTSEAFAKHREFWHSGTESSILSCPECGTKCEDVAAYPEHLWTCPMASKRIFACAEECLCRFTTSVPEHFTTHIEKSHVTLEKFRCYWCAVDHQTVGSLLEHISTDCVKRDSLMEALLKEPPAPVASLLPDCEPGRDLQSPQQQSAPHLEIVYKCGVHDCSHESLEREVFVDHVQVDHPGNVQHKCGYCEQAFVSVYTLVLHMEEKHREAPASSANSQSPHIQIASVVSLSSNEAPVELPQVQPEPKPYTVNKMVNKGAEIYLKEASLLCYVMSMREGEIAASSDIRMSLETWRTRNTVRMGKVSQHKIEFMESVEVVKLLKSVDAAEAMLKLPNVTHLYKCAGKECTFTSGDEDQFRAHLADCRQEYYLHCIYCGMKYKTNAGLVEHLSNSHGMSVHQCPSCLFRARTKVYLLLHMSVCHNAEGLMFYSGNLPVGRRTKEEMILDELSLALPVPCAVEGCEFITMEIWAFRRHHEEHHSNLAQVTCFHCLEQFGSLDAIEAHFSSHNMYNFHCLYCSYGTDDLRKLIPHLCFCHPHRTGRVFLRSGMQPPPPRRATPQLLPGVPQVSAVQQAPTTPINTQGVVVKTEVVDTSEQPTTSHERVQQDPSVPNSEPTAPPVMACLQNVNQPNVQLSAVTCASVIVPPHNAGPSREPSPSIITSRIPNLVASARREPSPMANTISEPSPIANTSEPSPITNTSEPSPIANTSEPSPIANTSEPSPIANTSEPSPIVNTGEPSPIVNPRSEPSPIVNTRSEPSPIASTSAVQSSLNNVSGVHIPPASAVIDGNKQFSCGYQACRFSASTIRDLKEHLQICSIVTADSNGPPLVCNQCQLVFWHMEREQFVNHIRSHQAKVYICGICNEFRTPLPHYVKKHMQRMHHRLQFEETKCVPRYPRLDGSSDELEAVEYVYQPVVQSLRIRLTPNNGAAVIAPPPPQRQQLVVDDLSDIPLQSIYQQEVKCARCNYSTKVRKNLIQHMEQHRRRSSETAEMDGECCSGQNEPQLDRSASATPESNQTIQSLQLWHPKEVPEYVPPAVRFKCGIKNCTHVAEKSADFEDHISSAHSDTFDLPCPHCSSIFKENSDLNRHISLHGPNLYRCSYCTYVNDKRYIVSGHCLVDHQGVPQLVKTIREVQELGEVPNNLANRKRRMESYSSEESAGEGAGASCDDQLICHKCRVFKSHSMAKMRNHLIQEMELQKHVCNKCGVSCSKFEDMKQHFEVVHGGADLNLMDITITMDPVQESLLDDMLEAQLANLQENKKKRSVRLQGATAASAGELDTAVGQLLTNSGEAAFNYACPACPLASPSVQVMQKHLHSHLQQTTFNCQFCSATVHQLANLKMHHQKNHPNCRFVTPRPISNEGFIDWIMKLLREEPAYHSKYE